MSYCLFIVLLALVVVILATLPWLLDVLFRRYGERGSRLCDQRCRIWIILALLIGFVLGGLLTCCRHELYAMITENRCRLVMIWGLLVLLALLYDYLKMVGRCGLRSLRPQDTEGSQGSILQRSGTFLGWLVLLLALLLLGLIWRCCRGQLAAGMAEWTYCHTLIVAAIFLFIILAVITYLAARFCDKTQPENCTSRLRRRLWLLIIIEIFLIVWVIRCCGQFYEPEDNDLAMVGIWWEGKNEGEEGVHLRWSFRYKTDTEPGLPFPDGGFDVQRRKSGAIAWTTLNAEHIFPANVWGDETAPLTGNMWLPQAIERLHPGTWGQFRGQPFDDLVEMFGRDPYSPLYYVETPAPEVYAVPPANPYLTEADRTAYLNAYYAIGTEADPMPPLVLWEVEPMGTILTTAMHSEIARLVGLYYLDKNADPNQEYDYRIVGYWPDKTRRYTVFRINRPNTEPLEQPILTTIESPVKVGEIDGKVLNDDRAVGMLWTPPAAENPPVVDGLLDTIKPILFTVEHMPVFTVDDNEGIEDFATLGTCTLPATLDFAPARLNASLIEALAGEHSEADVADDVLPPILVAPIVEACFKLTEFSFQGLELEEDGRLEIVLNNLRSLQDQIFCPEEAFWEAVKDKIGEDNTAEYKELILKHAIEDETTWALSWPQYFFYHKNLDYGCHAYRVFGMDIFGRPSPVSPAEVVTVADITGPPPPALATVTVYQRQDKTLSEAVRAAKFPDGSNHNHMIEVSWVWPEALDARAPDTHHFFIYAVLPDFEPFPGETPSIDPPMWRDPVNWSLREIGGPVAKSRGGLLPVQYASLGYLGTGSLYYVVNFNEIDLAAVGISLTALGLDPGDTEPVKYTYFGVAAVDRPPYSNSGDVSAPVLAVARDLEPPDPPDPGPDLASGPFEADKQGNRSLMLSWPGNALYAYAIYRANAADIEVEDSIDPATLPACFVKRAPVRSTDMDDVEWEQAQRHYRIRATIAKNLEDLLTSGIFKRMSPLPIAPESGLAQFTDKVDGTVSSEQIFAATAFDKAGNESGLSCSSPVILIEDGVPPRPPVLRETSGGDNQISIKWNTNQESDLAWYNLYRTANPDFLASRRKMDWIAGLRSDGTDDPMILPNTPDATAEGTGAYSTWTFVDTGVRAGTTYYYRIEAIDLVGNRSELSQSGYGLAYDTIPPSPPIWSSLASTVGRYYSTGKVSIDLNWEAVPDDPVLRIQVQRQEDGMPLWRTVGGWLEPGVMTFSDSAGLQTGTTYHYRLRAMDPSGNRSGWSSLHMVTLSE